MLININYHIWYKVCRPIKHKYSISTNCILILNGCYLLSAINNKPYTNRQLRSFVSYYNHNKISSFITILLNKGYLVHADSKNTRDYYILSSSGLSVINELNESYEIELRKFIDLYSIVL
jgi:predicted transcriptional regulator